MRILITGGTGHLGTAIVARLKEEGHHVRILARHPGVDDAVDWIQGDLATGEGVERAVDGVETVIHAATNSPAARRGGLRPLDLVRSPKDVDVDGTNTLLRAAEDAGVEHFIHVSIVGLESTARVSPYSRVKLEAERLVRESAVPWSIVRATPFYWLLERMLAKMSRRSFLLLPAVHMGAVDSDEFARFVAACVTDGRRGEREDFVGPEALTMRELAQAYLTARGLQKRIWSLPLPHRVTDALEAGSGSSGARRGETTWTDWLRKSAESAPRIRAAA
jgi:uncharacterized protein YbjT (DUF2867 family)